VKTQQSKTSSGHKQTSATKILFTAKADGFFFDALNLKGVQMRVIAACQW
jgi:hypothetical protein